MHSFSIAAILSNDLSVRKKNISSTLPSLQDHRSLSQQQEDNNANHVTKENVPKDMDHLKKCRLVPLLSSEGDVIPNTKEPSLAQLQQFAARTVFQTLALQQYQQQIGLKARQTGVSEKTVSLNSTVDERRLRLRDASLLSPRNEITSPYRLQQLQQQQQQHELRTQQTSKGPNDSVLSAMQYAWKYGTSFPPYPNYSISMPCVCGMTSCQQLGMH